MAWREYRDLLRQMEGEMQRMAEEGIFGFVDVTSGGRFWHPAADIHETEEGMVVKLEVAGVTTDRVSVALSGDGRRLTVAGVRSEQHAERESRVGVHQLEIYFGPFERTFTIPPGLVVDRDNITATLRDGFLTVILPRRKPIRRTIPVETDFSGYSVHDNHSESGMGADANFSSVTISDASANADQDVADKKENKQ